MSVCWYCHWGWPKQARDIYNDAVRELDDGAFVVEIDAEEVATVSKDFVTLPPMALDACPLGHEKLDGPCRSDYCRCGCARCRKECGTP